MTENWHCVQQRLCDCDPLTIHHSLLNCNLSHAVKFKSFIFKIQFLQPYLFCCCLNWLGNQFRLSFTLAGKIVDLLALFA